MRSLIIFALISLQLFSQKDISGLWVAYGNKNPYYGLIYIEQGNFGKIEGVTYDETKTGYCNYKLKGQYNEKNQLLNASNNHLLKKSPIHLPGIYNLEYSKIGDKEFLIGEWSCNDSLSAIEKGVDISNIKNTKSTLVLKVIYERPITKTIDKIEFIKPLIKKNIGFISVYSPIETKEDITEEKFRIEKNKRENVLLHSVVSNSKDLILQIRDYDKEDGDKISIYLGTKTIRYNMLIRSNTIQMYIPLPLNEKKIELCFSANNLGKIPPNTAYLKVLIDGKKHEETVFTDKTHNSCFIINRK